MRIETTLDMLPHLAHDLLSFLFNQIYILLLTHPVLPPLHLHPNLLHSVSSHMLQILFNRQVNLVVTISYILHITLHLLPTNHQPTQNYNSFEKINHRIIESIASFLNWILLLLVSVSLVLRVIHLLTMTRAQLQTAVRTNLLNRL